MQQAEQDRPATKEQNSRKSGWKRPRFVPISEEDKKKIVDLKKEGLTQKEVAKAVGCNHSTVSRVLNESAQKTVKSLGLVREFLTPTEVQERIVNHAPTAVAMIAKLMGSNTEAISLAASKDILDRAGFKPVEKTLALVGVEAMTQEELKEGFGALLERVIRRTGEANETASTEESSKKTESESKNDNLQNNDTPTEPTPETR